MIECGRGQEKLRMIGSAAGLLTAGNRKSQEPPVGWKLSTAKKKTQYSKEKELLNKSIISACFTVTQLRNVGTIEK